MKIVIEHGKTKRRIDGPWNICGSREDLESLVSQLQRRLSGDPFHYGWVRIEDKPYYGLAETPPVPWD
jgi:hypothetical protein